VLTSSISAVVNPSDKPGCWDETSWNADSPKDVEENGAKALQTSKYRTSKVVAEKGTFCGDAEFDPVPRVYVDLTAAWKFVEDNKSSISWDLAVINPPFVRESLPSYVQCSADTLNRYSV